MKKPDIPLGIDGITFTIDNSKEAIPVTDK